MDGEVEREPFAGTNPSFEGRMRSRWDENAYTARYRAVPVALAGCHQNPLDTPAKMGLMGSSQPNRRPCSVCGSVSKHCKLCHDPARATIEAELLAGVDQVGVSRRFGISARALARHLSDCIPDKVRKAKRIRETVEAFAAVGRLESIESVIGEVRSYRRAAAEQRDYNAAIRGCDVALRALTLIASRPSAQESPPDVSDALVIKPSQPLDLERLAQLNEVIRARQEQATAPGPSPEDGGSPPSGGRLSGPNRPQPVAVAPRSSRRAEPEGVRRTPGES